MLKAFEFTSASKVVEACGSRMRFATARYIQVIQGTRARTLRQLEGRALSRPSLVGLREYPPNTDDTEVRPSTSTAARTEKVHDT